MTTPGSADEIHSWAGYVLAILVTVAAALLRWVLDPLLGDLAQYTVFLLTVAIVAAVAGWRAGLTAVGLGGAAGFALFIYLPGRFTPTSPSHYVQLALYAFVCSIITVLV